ncbi:MAG: YggT family protein [bacterium]|nr:YggT family protein [bacterium]
MTEIIKETVTTQSDSANAVVAAPTKIKATNSQTVEYLVYFFFGALEILLAFRLVLKLAGASISSAFVGLIYGLTGIAILPFEGIFRRGFAQGIETTSVLEPSTMVAIIVYAVLAWGIVKLVRISSGEQQPTD